MPLSAVRIGMLGLGHMGLKVAKTMQKAGAHKVIGYDPRVRGVDGVTDAASAEQVLNDKQLDFLFLGMRPQDFTPKLQDAITRKIPYTTVSIMAGLPVANINIVLNQLLSVGECVKLIQAEDDVSQERRTQFSALLKPGGPDIWVANEPGWMNKGIAASGSGPYYPCPFMKLAMKACFMGGRREHHLVGDILDPMQKVCPEVLAISGRSEGAFDWDERRGQSGDRAQEVWVLHLLEAYASALKGLGYAEQVAITIAGHTMLGVAKKTALALGKTDAHGVKPKFGEVVSHMESSIISPGGTTAEAEAVAKKALADDVLTPEKLKQLFQNMVNAACRRSAELGAMNRGDKVVAPKGQLSVLSASADDTLVSGEQSFQPK